MGTRHSWGWAAAVLGSVLAVAACSSKERHFVSGNGDPLRPGDETSLGAGSNDASAGPQPSSEGPPTVDVDLGETPDETGETALANIGAACASSVECASAFCVDGVCCDTKCGDLCATCAAPGSVGTCAPAASDPACDELGCAGGTECRGYDQTQLTLNCEGIGQCRSGIECAPLDQAEGISCQAGSGACNGVGECLVPGKAVLGASCVADAECGEGHCVARDDGTSICCDSACNGVCEQCSDGGRCVEAPVTDERCAAVTCPGDSVCRDYQDGITTNLCRGFGQCKSPQDCTFDALRVSAACECDANGGCSLTRGQRCASDAECGLGACEPSVTGDTVCCAAACGGGLSCSRDGLECVECDGSTISCDGATEVRCNDGASVPANCQNGCTLGAGCNALAPVGFSCTSVACQAGAVCQTDVTGAQRCCSRDCAAEGKICADNGSCVCPEGQAAGAGSSCLLQAGDPCGPGTPACEAGLTCVDGVCCTGACAAECESCNLLGSVGQCAFNAQDVSQCGAGEQCVALGDCRLRTGQSCAGSDASCVSNSCEPQLGVNGATVCCGETCNAQRPFCSRDGARCLQCESNADCPNGCQNGLCRPLRALGEVCDVATQCGSGVCTRINGTPTSRCCGQCQGGQVCNATGGCECPPNQVLVNGQCRRSNGQECTRDDTNTECVNNSCESAVDGRFRCCGEDCAPGTELCAQNGSGCVDQRGGVGSSCTTAGDCQSGNCIDGFCCDGPCNNSCERCNAPGQAGRCTAEAGGTACGGGLECFGRNRCLASVGDTCSVATSCGEGVCIPSVPSGALVCCGEACSVREPYCTQDGTTCVECRTDADCGNGCDVSTNTCRPLLADGVSCTTGNQCSTGACREQFPDADNDRFPSATGGIRVCGNAVQTAGGVRRIFVRADGATDCCDSDSRAFPGATVPFGTPTPAGCGGGGFDFNCSGASTTVAERLQNCSDATIAACSNRGGWIFPDQSPDAHPAGIPPRCGENGYVAPCVDMGQGCQGFSGGVTARRCL